MAVYPVSPGNPDYSTGSSSQYIPAIYSALLIKKFYPTTVFGAISNTDYEGDIKSSGDTIYIRTRPTIETFTYKKGMVLPVQNPESPYVTMKIDQGEGFSFAIDKVDEFQSDLKLMNIWAEDATAQMKQVIDRKVLATIAYAAGGVAATGPTLTAPKLIAGGTTATGTSIATATATRAASPGLGASAGGINLTDATRGDDIIGQILYYGQLLDENNAPDEGRFIVLPPALMQALKDTNSKLAQTYVTGDATSPIRNGKVGNIDRFEIYSSNNLAKGSNGGWAVIFGQKYATTFATQITESRIIDNPFSFGKMMQGLQVYGFQIIKPEFLGVDFIVL
jgi:hypothetical protein